MNGTRTPLASTNAVPVPRHHLSARGAAHPGRPVLPRDERPLASGRAGREQAAASTDGHRLVTLGDHSLRVWDRSHWKLLEEIPETASVWKVAFLDRGKTLLVQTELGLRMYRVADGAELLDLRGVHPVRAMAISPVGSRIATQVDHAIDFLDGRRTVKE